MDNFRSTPTLDHGPACECNRGKVCRCGVQDYAYTTDQHRVSLIKWEWENKAYYWDLVARKPHSATDIAPKIFGLSMAAESGDMDEYERKLSELSDDELEELSLFQGQQ